jgi:hypothetical protein
LPSRHSALRWRFSPGGVGKISERHFFHLHNISHLGRLASRPFFSSRYVWCCLAKEVATLAKTCLHCQQSKIHRHIPIPQWQFSHLGIDLVGPLHYSNNCNYIFIVTDCTSKWMEAVPPSAIFAADCA